MDAQKLGDMNATMNPAEATTRPHLENQASALYQDFLHRAGGSDAWNEQDDTDVTSGWTHRAKNDGNVKHILDRVAHSLPVETVTVKQRGFVGGSDHRLIWTSIALPFVVNGKDAESIPNPLLQRLKLPDKKDPTQAQCFAKLVDEEIAALQLEKLDVTTEEGWNSLYESLTTVLRNSGETTYGLRGAHTKKKKHDP